MWVGNFFCFNLPYCGIWGSYSCVNGRYQWPRGLRHRSTAACLLRLWVRIPPGTWMFVCCECCLLSGRGLCDEPIPRPEESYRLWCVVICDLETSWMRRPWPTGGCCGFESHRRVWMSVVSVVCCKVEVSATSWSLVQRSPTDCDASLYVI